jgi:hypothetical protein
MANQSEEICGGERVLVLTIKQLCLDSHLGDILSPCQDSSFTVTCLAGQDWQ